MEYKNMKNDILFQLLFGQQKYENLLISLINSILQLPFEQSITSIIVDGNFRLENCTPNEKVGIIDIRAIASNNSIINIEMQVMNEYNMDKRTLFYWSKLFCGQIQKGDPFSLLKKTITINILDFKYFDNEGFHSVFRLCEDTHNELILDDLEIHFIELPKFRRIARNYKNSLNNWLLFIDGGEKEEMEMAKKEDPIIQVAEEAREYIMSDPQTQRLYELREKYIMDEITNLQGARQEGIKKGMDEGIKKGMDDGIKKGKIETAARMLKKGYSIDEICEVTGLGAKDLSIINK